MRIQFSTTRHYSSPILANGLNFESVPPGGGGTKIDPPDNTTSGTSSTPTTTTEPPPEEEEGTVEADAS